MAAPARRPHGQKQEAESEAKAVFSSAEILNGCLLHDPKWHEIGPKFRHTIRTIVPKW
jgi:hypothetical protein